MHGALMTLRFHPALLYAALSAPFALAGPATITPDAPHLESWLGMTLHDVPKRGGGKAAVRRLAEADAAFATGDPDATLHHLRAAIDALPDQAPACGVHGALRTLEIRLASLTEGSPTGPALRELNTRCLSSEVQRDQELAQRYLRTIDRIRVALGVDASDLDAELDSPAKRRAIYERAQELAADLPEGAALQIRALADALLMVHPGSEDPCDQETPDEAHRAFEALSADFEQAGRTDRVMWLALGRLPAAGRIDASRLAPLLSLVEREEYRWLLDQALLKSFTKSAFASAPDHPSRIRWCDEVGAAIDRVDHRDSSVSTNASLARVSLIGLTRCPEPERWQHRAEASFRRAAQGDAIPFLQAALHHFAPLVFGLFGGQPQAVAQFRHFVRLADDLRDELGDSPDDRMVRASLGVTIHAVEEFLLGQEGALLTALRESSSELNESLESGRRTRRGLARELPAAHIAANLLLVGYSHLVEKPEISKEALANFEATVERDLSTWLRAHGARAHVQALRRLGRAGEALLAKELSDDPSDAVEWIELASTPGRREARWWRLGLEAGRVLAWDALGMLVHESHPEVLDRALSRSDVILTRLVPALIEDFELDSARWELLHLAPAIHRAALWGMSGRESDELFLAPADALMTAAMQNLSEHTRGAGPQDLGHFALVRDLLDVVAEYGFARLEEGDAGPELVLRLADRAQSYPPLLRSMTRLILGRALRASDPERAVELFQVPEQDRDERELSVLVPVLDLFYADALLEAPGQERQALVAIDRVIASGARHRSCGLRHPGEAVRPARAHLLARLGQTEEALEEIRAYLEDVDAERSTGEGVSDCEIKASVGNLSMQAKVEFHLLSQWVRTGESGTFNAGMGFSDRPQTTESTSCRLRWTEGVRHDLVAHAHLFRAALHYRDGHPQRAMRDAHAALTSVLRLQSGFPATLGERGTAAIGDSKENLDIGMLAWVSTLAALHAAPMTADNLRTGALNALTERELSWEDVLDDAPPVALRGLGFEDLAPVVRRWSQLTDATSSGNIAATLQEAGPSLPHPDYPEVLEILLLQSNSEVPQAQIDERIRAMSPSADPHARRLQRLLSAVLNEDREQIEASARDLSNDGRHEEVALVLALHAHALRRSGSPQPAIAQLELARDLLPPQTSSMLLVWLLQQSLAHDPTAIERPGWTSRFVEIADGQRGAIDVPLEHMILHTIAFDALSRRDYPAARRFLARFTELHRAVASPSPAEVLPLRTILFAIDAARGEPDLEEIRAMQLIASQEQGVDPAIGYAIKALSERCHDADACAQISLQLLTNIN